MVCDCIVEKGMWRGVVGVGWRLRGARDEVKEEKERDLRGSEEWTDS